MNWLIFTLLFGWRFQLLPLAGTVRLELTTLRLTAGCSTYWAIRQYIYPNKFGPHLGGQVLTTTISSIRHFILLLNITQVYGGTYRTWTDNLLRAKQVLSQLRYCPKRMETSSVERFTNPASMVVCFSLWPLPKPHWNSGICLLPHFLLKAQVHLALVPVNVIQAYITHHSAIENSNLRTRAQF